MSKLKDFNIHPEVLDYINKICPVHWRTSCSDDDIGNWLYSRNEEWYGRCTRCNLLELTRYPIPEKLKECEYFIGRFDW